MDIFTARRIADQTIAGEWRNRKDRFNAFSRLNRGVTLSGHDTWKEDRERATAIVDSFNAERQKRTIKTAPLHYSQH